DRNFDVYDDEGSQMYMGVRGEDNVADRAVRDTAGEVCETFDGHESKIFCTYYCAVCGGGTVRGTEVFSDAAPPLAAVKCDYCREARLYRWTAEISKGDMQKELDPWLKEKGQPTGALKTVSLVRATGGGATIPEFDVRSGKQSVRISGSELRVLLSGRGLYSPQFTIADRGRVLEISGRGHGHGVGLCQWGARGQALEGKTCPQILQHYYPGSTIATRTWK
ncbi:MAG: SpoIID/LytB domain-containing protein, partial [Planctomycetia bacterium]|nr:SpoIID/LytB domain-containing protein [Planctomycetia bacterium]